MRLWLENADQQLQGYRFGFILNHRTIMIVIQCKTASPFAQQQTKSYLTICSTITLFYSNTCIINHFIGPALISQLDLSWDCLPNTNIVLKSYNRWTYNTFSINFLIQGSRTKTWHDFFVKLSLIKIQSVKNWHMDFLMIIKEDVVQQKAYEKRPTGRKKLQWQRAYKITIILLYLKNYGYIYLWLISNL